MNRTALVLFAAAALVGSQVNAQPPLPVIDHYDSYRVEPQTLGATVTVGDQFIPQMPVQVLVYERLLNPVKQDGEAYVDSTAHLNWWRIEPNPNLNRRVIVTNKFGQGVWDIFSLEFLLAPSRKNQPPPLPENINHFLCYRSIGPSRHRQVVLEDQFRRFSVQVGPPDFFCNPCQKEHAGRVFPIVNPEAHLAVYRIDPPTFTTQVFTFDQFGEHPTLVVSSPPEFLFVPSLKEEPVPVEPGTWGRIKSLYADPV
jgi:hypothetical protein